MKPAEKKLYTSLIVLLIAGSSVSLFGELMEPDGALYASIAKTIALRNDWLNLYVQGADWLDKPHLPFWLAAASYKIFGISAFAYKLPSFLIGLLGAFYLYLFSKELYGQRTALISTLIFLSALHVIISNFDVRAESYLSTFIIAAIYHYNIARKRHFLSIVPGSFFAACAVMVKGIFILVPVFGGFFIYWMLNRQYKELINPKWWIAVLLIVLFILPELYSLYVQFDLHPEKIVFGQTHVSGLKFFFWDSQFGRFFNTGPIKGKGDLSFFLHTNIWAFLPWSILFYTAVIQLSQKKNRTEMPAESTIIWASAVLTFVLFSCSKFQLPHYIIILFPQFSILTAVYLRDLSGKSLKIFFIVQNVISLIVVVLLVAIAFLFQVNHQYGFAALMVLLLTIAFTLIKGLSIQTIITRNVLTSFALIIFLYLFFYPALLNYQAGMLAGKWLNENYQQAKIKVMNQTATYAFDFYAEGEVAYLNGLTDLKKEPAELKKEVILYISASTLDALQKESPVTILKKFDYYRITKLKLKFLNNQTRPSVLEPYYLVKTP